MEGRAYSLTLATKSILSEMVISLLGLFVIVASAANLPTVVWHGLGDSADSEGILSLLDLLSNHTSSPAYAISTGPRDSSFVGNVNLQLADVCTSLKANSDLQDGFNAIGFSQGGQFLRAYVERCNDPPLKNLMTWGSQHSGIVQVPCSSDSSPLCQSSRFFVRNNAFSSFVQNRIVPAQYYRGFDFDKYVQGSIFLADINNQKPVKNQSYKHNLQTLTSFVMIKFEEDVTVIPKESSHFEEVDEDGIVTRVQNTTYWNDLGLKELFEKKRLISLTVEGAHMQINQTQLLDFVDEYFQNSEDFTDESQAGHLSWLKKDYL